MKLAIAFAAILAVGSAQFQGFSTPRPYQYRPSTVYPSPPPRPVNYVSNEAQAKTLRLENDSGPDGSYRYDFETDNGIFAQAQGTPRDFGGNPPVVPVVSQGAFAWTSPEGQPISITFTADENGYRAQGDALPTPPPIPEPILRALEYIARNPPKN